LRLVGRVVLTALATGMVVLSVANRQPVTLALNPFAGPEGPVVTVPLFALVFAVLACGVVIGALSRKAPRGRTGRPPSPHCGRAARHRGPLRRLPSGSIRKADRT
jgi:hypothetical protein